MSDLKNFESEEWRLLPKAPGYAISSLGRVKSLPRKILRRNRWGSVNLQAVRERILRPGIGTVGYRLVSTHIGSAQVTFYIHNAMMEVFGPPRPFPDAVVRHLNDDKLDNRVENLAWGSRKNNMDDAIRNGLIARGEAKPNAKMTAAKVRELRRLVAAGSPLWTLAKHYGISGSTAKGIVEGRSWRHV